MCKKTAKFITCFFIVFLLFFTVNSYDVKADKKYNEIYSLAYINKDIASTNGYITYSTNSFLTNQNMTNTIGKKPYNIVAWRSRGRLSSDLVIGNEDASIIMSSPNLKNAIKNCKVIFIID